MSAGGEMPRIGVITNPGSQRNKAGLGELRELLDGASNVEHAILDKITDIPEILRGFARREVGVVAVAGGDGTVQAALTELYGQRPFESDPLLVVVPRGMTNMIAADVGLKRRGLKGLQRLLAADAETLARACLTRRILRLENALNHQPQYGMFFGGAGITRAIEACRSKVHPYNIKSDSAAAVTLAGLLGGWLLRGGKGGRKEGSIFYGDRIAMTFDEAPRETLESLLVLATTLDKLILGSRPFWGGDAGHLRFTAIAYPPKGILRYALRILYGGPERKLAPETYLSRSVRRVALAMDCPFTLDGEIFEPTPGKEIVLTAADEARFVRL
ncbi:diacylglycerol kinase family protein [Pelagibius marinus]|uniref:diacylglycerol kinase family protein n=1 Tax=Pelagibius marinus TaxID=2762760 RepID=UPI0018728566|nr:diacylglycerol kinase family protein [Pelagibius marinus]